MFHRVIIDECHLARYKSDVEDLRAAHKWAVTGTPFQGSARDLLSQAYLIGQARSLEHVTTKYQSEKGSKGATRALVAALRPRMIRHTKAQRIGGAVALALPDEVVSTVTLEQSSAERAEYKAAVSRGAYRVSSMRGGGKPCFALAMALSAHRQACQRSRVKRHALFADLQSRAAGSGCRAVIFTEYREVHADIVSQLRMRFPGFEVFEFSGGTAAAKRHSAIRSFQANDGRNKVFVITMRAGNVGITLTAADVVYLLVRVRCPFPSPSTRIIAHRPISAQGPCVDPSDEVQAAGRIHRLGQTRRVLLKKFVMKGTTDEESIVEMHAKQFGGSS